jgi:hypothetical protein
LEIKKWRDLPYRPRGITAVVVLLIIIAASLIFVIAFSFAEPELSLLPLFGVSSLDLSIVAQIYLPVAGINLLVAYGLFNGKQWAWQVTIVLSIIAIVAFVIGMFTINVVGANVIISGIVLYYMLTPGVKEYFGKT